MKIVREGFWDGVKKGFVSTAPKGVANFINKMDQISVDKKNKDYYVDKIARFNYDKKTQSQLLGIIASCPDLGQVFTRQRYTDMRVLSLLASAYNQKILSKPEVSELVRERGLLYDQLSLIVYGVNHGIDIINFRDEKNKLMTPKQITKVIMKHQQNPDDYNDADTLKNADGETRTTAGKLGANGFKTEPIKQYLKTENTEHIDDTTLKHILWLQVGGASNAVKYTDKAGIEALGDFKTIIKYIQAANNNDERITEKYMEKVASLETCLTNRFQEVRDSFINGLKSKQRVAQPNKENANATGNQ